MRASIAADAYAALGWLLSALFAARVLGQALQRWQPQSFLPPAEAFQGSSLPYGLLLAAQLVILAAMVYFTWRMQRRTLSPRRGIGIPLAWVGTLYMTGALGRIAVGLAFPGAHSWFRAWIPAFFHLVLAGFVLTVSIYHLRKSGGV